MGVVFWCSVGGNGGVACELMRVSVEGNGV